MVDAFIALELGIGLTILCFIGNYCAKLLYGIGAELAKLNKLLGDIE